MRDLARCAFVGTGGRRCGERGFLEFHHVRPYAVGGEPAVDNVQLRCRRHNDYEARVYFAREPLGEDGGLARDQPCGGNSVAPESAAQREPQTNAGRHVEVVLERVTDDRHSAVTSRAQVIEKRPGTGSEVGTTAPL